MTHDFELQTQIHIYMKGRKVGGTSVEIALAPRCGPSDIVTPITAADEFERLETGGACRNYSNDGDLEARYLRLVREQKFDEAFQTRVHFADPARFYNHMALWEVEARLAWPTDEFTLVVSERNPYAKIISYANMHLSFSDYCGDVMENSTDAIRQSIGMLFQNGTFRECRNVGLYQSEKSYRELIILRQESLNADLARLFTRLELGDAPEHWPHAKQGMGSQLIDPETMFTRPQLDLVNREFAAEFQIFGYAPI